MGNDWCRQQITIIPEIKQEFKLECAYCGTFEQEPFIQLKCGHLSQQKCLSKWIIFQIDTKQAFIIKCKVCGTKTNTKEIRKSELPDRLILLNSLFNKQLDILLLQLRKTPDYNDYLQQKERSKQHGDYYFFPNQKQLEYEETPQ